MSASVSIKSTSRSERVVEYRLNGIFQDSVLIDFEKDTYFDNDVFTVKTWYDTNEPYSFNSVEKDMEFSNIPEARKEMRKRCLNWEKKFNSLN